MSNSDLVVKSNRLNTAIQNLSLTEIRLIQLAIIDARETNRGLATDQPLRIDSKRYAKAFNVTRQAAFAAIVSAEKTLFERRFSFLNEKSRVVKSRWVQRVEYIEDESAIEIMFTYDVVNEITRLDGAVDFFTKYLLKQTASMNSMYSVRLYELLIQWREAKKTPVFELDQFRDQLGIGVNEYQVMSDFKKGVLLLAVKEINDKSDIKVKVDQHKKGRRITGFSFTLSPNKKAKKPIEPVEDDTKDDNAKDDTKVAVLEFSDKQLDTYSRLLANLSELGGNAPVGATVNEYAAIIAKDLIDPIKQQYYTKHLDKVGYKTK